MDANTRFTGVQKIFDLHDKKEYKAETLFTAVNIFDHYIAAIGVHNFNKHKTI